MSARSVQTGSPRQERRFTVSREEAASVYLDVLLGFRGEYRRFREALETLTDREKVLLQCAVSLGATKQETGR